MGTRKNENGRYWKLMDTCVCGLSRMQREKEALEWAIETTGQMDKAAEWLGIDQSFFFKRVRTTGADAKAALEKHAKAARAAAPPKPPRPAPKPKGLRPPPPMSPWVRERRAAKAAEPPPTPPPADPEVPCK